MSIKIAIIGAGTVGLVQAIALKKKFGNQVNVYLFEKHQYFELTRGVELSVGSGFQLVMQALGCDMTAELQQYGYLYNDVSVMDNMGTCLPQVEQAIRNTGIFSVNSAQTANGDKVAINIYSISRGIFMYLLHKKLLMVTGGNEIIFWGCELDHIMQDNAKQTLYFKDGRVFKDFDLVIGAGGVHSAVRKQLFDSRPATHVGTNILYGVIPGQVEMLNEHKFNIICSKNFSTVACCYKDLKERLFTWWAIVYLNKIECDTPEEYRAFWESQTDVKLLTEQLVSGEPAGSYPKRYLAVTTEFKYAGLFLERAPLTLERWGIDNTVLIGDAAHAMQPWAGVGASMAAEDAFLLAELIDQYGFDQLQSAFDALQQQRINRLCYYHQITINNTPRGILPADLSCSIEDTIARYGDQRPLTASPAWRAL